MSMRIAIRSVVFVFLFSSLLLAQDSTASGASARTDAGQQPQTTGQPSSPKPANDLAQMRDDLNKMESLNLNMSSEIEFLHDQNLQILLNELADVDHADPRSTTSTGAAGATRSYPCGREEIVDCAQ